MDKRNLLGGMHWSGERTGAKNPYYSGPLSDHFDGQRFFNPGGAAPNSIGDAARWKLAGRAQPWPRKRASPFSAARPEARVEDKDLRVTMVGHATLLIQTAGLNILTDPVWSTRASPLSIAGPARYCPPGIAMNHLPPLDVILISHNHYDHLDVASLKKLVWHHDPLVVTPLGNDVIIRKHVPDVRIAVRDWGGHVDIGDNARINLEPVHHWSARGLGDRCMALWAGFVLSTPGGRIYHVGDTGFHDGVNYRAVAERYGGFRLAILPIGAYEPRWFMQAQHQNPEEAVAGMLLCKADYAIGHHFATFRLTDEGIDDPVRALNSALTRRTVDAGRFLALEAGQVWDIPAMAQNG